MIHTDNIPFFVYVVLLSTYLSYSVGKAYFTSTDVSLNLAGVTVFIAAGIVIMFSRGSTRGG